MGSNTLGKAATLDELLSTCIKMFDHRGELSNSHLPRTFLLMHRWYLPSTELAGKLLSLYRDASGENCSEIRLKICYFMRYWIMEFPAEFNLDLGLVRLTEEFQELASHLGYEEHIHLIDISSIPSYDWMRRVTQRKKPSKKGKACLLFDHLEPIELAEHLTFLEHKSFRRISFTDYQSYVIHGCLDNNPTLERSIALFNGISKWVQLMVLSKPTPQQRAEVITKFINVAQKLLHLQNFNTLMAVVGGLSHSSISRLKETHSHLSSEVSKQPTSPTTPNKTVVPLEWASGVIPKPDPNLINKHIQKLVDSVFRNYDHDHDGYISQEDFESIAANFPFLDSFCVLDKDQDGLISKGEMMAYFLRAKSQLQCKMGPGFIHNFQEMTYLKPTFCEHCAGFLWGIIKQGYKCKDCGANCHKQCRDLLVLACRKFARGMSLGSSHGSLPNSPSLPAVQGEVFNFPSVTPQNQDLDSRAITLVTGNSRKISVHLQRVTTSQATQTEPLWHESGWGDSGPHTFPKMKSKLHGKSGKNKGFAKWENEKSNNQANMDTAVGTTAHVLDHNGTEMLLERQEMEDS
nr:ras guanyl-releasing protein 3 isoform X2 [Zootoca vivipara]